MLWVAATQLLLSMVDRSVLYAEAAKCMSSAESVGMLKCELCCELLVLLNMSHMGCFVCGRLWSEQC